MNDDVMTDNEEFWDRAADQYDAKIDKVKFYDAMVRRIAEDIGSAERVLEVACGTGRVALEIAEQSTRIDAVDSSRKMVDIAVEKAASRNVDNVTFSVQSAYSLDSPDSCFDAVVACNALHLMQRQDLALAEIQRVIKTGGLLVAPTYCHGQTLVAHIASRIVGLRGLRTYRRFTYRSLVLSIQKAGFKIEKFEVWPAVIPMAYVSARAQ